MFKKIAFFALFLAVTGLFAATSVNAQRLIRGGFVKSAGTTTTDTLLEPVPEANPSFDPSQCANGGISNPQISQDCGTNGADTNWETGNMNGSKAHYAEGKSIHYRYVFSNLSGDGTTVYTIRLAYDAFKAPTQHAIDYLNTYDTGVDGAYVVNPCGSVAGCSFVPALTDTIDIPQDPNLQNYITTAGAEGIEPPNVPGTRVFTGWGLTFLTASFENYDPANAERVIKITFSSSNTKAVLAWSGHVALGSEWNAFLGGAHGGAGSISGSPYHMRNAGLGSFGDGQRELQLAANAVTPTVTAADASVAGRVLDPYGRAVSSAKLVLTDVISGEVKTVYTNTFGYYKFEGAQAGDFFVLTVSHRRYTFATPSVSFSLSDSIDGLNFQAAR